MREVLGVLGCTWVTEVGDYSTNGFEASQYFTNRHGCTHANRLTINCWHGGCFSQGSPWRITAVRADSVTLQHCLACTVGTEPSPPFWAWAEGSASRSWTISKALRTAAPPRPGLLRAGWLQSPGSQAPPRSSLKQLLPAGINGLLCERGSGVCLWVSWRGTVLVHRCHTTQVAPPLYGVEAKRNFLCSLSLQGLV